MTNPVRRRGLSLLPMIMALALAALLAPPSLSLAEESAVPVEGEIVTAEEQVDEPSAQEEASPAEQDADKPADAPQVEEEAVEQLEDEAEDPGAADLPEPSEVPGEGTDTAEPSAETPEADEPSQPVGSEQTDDIRAEGEQADEPAEAPEAPHDGAELESGELVIQALEAEAEKNYTSGDWVYCYRDNTDANGKAVRHLYIVNYIGSSSSITVPDKIGSESVYGISFDNDKKPSECWQVKSITVSKGIKMIHGRTFEFNKMLENITFAPGSELVIVSNFAFEGCEKLKSFTMPPKLKIIGTRALDGCYALTDLYFNDVLLPLRDNPQWDSLETKGMYFNPCPRSLGVTYHVPSSSQNYKLVGGVLMSKDGTVLYAHPDKLANSSYAVPSGVTTIAMAAFQFNDVLAKVTLPNTLKSIGSSAFGTTGLADVVIPDSVSFIGLNAFSNCTSLASVKIGSGVKDLYANNEGNQFYQCPNLKSVTLSEGLEAIGNASFAETGITSINIPSTVKQINYAAFGDCFSLASVTGGKGVERIYRLAFMSTAIKSYPFGPSIEFVSGQAFYNCAQFDGKHPASLTITSDRDRDGVDDYINADTFFDDIYYINGSYSYKNASEVLGLVNAERAKQGLSALVLSDELTEAAMQRAAELSVLFSHTRPDGSDCFTASSRAHRENIAAGQGSPSAVMNSWMNSDWHRANILGADNASIGIGCVSVDGTMYWVQLFGSESSSPCKKTGTEARTATINIVYSDDVSKDGGGADRNDPFSSVRTLAFGASYKLRPYITCGGWISLTPLEAKSFTWKSSDTSVATVSADGTVTAKRKAGFATITATTKGGRTFTIQVSTLAFKDVNKGTPHYDDIMWLAANGISTGFPDGTFKPYASVARCDMAAFLYRLAGSPNYTPTAKDKAYFSDVNDRTPHAKEIWWLASKGISRGWDERNGTHTFRPYQSVARCDMAAFLYRLAGSPAYTPSAAERAYFSDISASSPHANEVWWLASKGVSAGWTERNGSHTFKPYVKVARCDMAAFLHRMDSGGMVPQTR